MIDRLFLAHHHAQQFARNHSLPVFIPYGSRHNGWRGGSDVSFPPSRALFDKHFTGKKLNYNEWGGKKTDKLVPAEFKRIGWGAKKSK